MDYTVTLFMIEDIKNYLVYAMDHSNPGVLHLNDHTTLEAWLDDYGKLNIGTSFTDGDMIIDTDLGEYWYIRRTVDDDYDAWIEILGDNGRIIIKEYANVVHDTSMTKEE